MKTQEVLAITYPAHCIWYSLGFLLKLSTTQKEDNFYLSLLFLQKKNTWWGFEYCTVSGWDSQQEISLKSDKFYSFHEALLCLPNFFRRTYWNRSCATNFILEYFKLWPQILLKKSLCFFKYDICDPPWIQDCQHVVCVFVSRVSCLQKRLNLVWNMMITEFNLKTITWDLIWFRSIKLSKSWKLNFILTSLKSSHCSSREIV